MINKLHFTRSFTRSLAFAALAIFMMMPGKGWGQGSETFTNSALTASYADGSFTGDNSVTWTYVHSRNEDTYGITGKGIMLRRLSSNSKVYSASVSGGIANFTCDLKKAFTGSGNRQVELFINNVSKGTSIAWDNTSVQTFTINNINITGSVVVEIRNITANQVIVDNISWTGYAAVSAPTLTTPTVSSITTTGATLGATVTSNGGASLTSRGTVWGTSAAPTGNLLAEGGTAVSAFSHARTGLSPNTFYYFRGYAVNTASLTGYSSDGTFYTLANVPSAPTVNSPTASTLDVAVNVNNNPAATEFAIHETSTDSYVQADGTLGLTAVWQTASVWSTITVSGLSPLTPYTFEVKARNGASVETAFGATAGETTLSSGASTPPALTAASGATVDAPFDITYTNDGTWEGVITGITIGGTALTAGFTVSSNKITFTPSASVPASLLQSSGTKNFVVSATDYTNATVSQTIGFGADNKLAMKIQPSAPASNGAVLGTQPEVYIQDQYGNTTTSTASVDAAVGAGTWSLGGTANASGIAGTATFSGLTATSASAVTGATITFSSTGLTGITSEAFNIPAPVPYILVGTITGFGNQDINTTSSEKTYNISGFNLTADIIITPPTGFLISSTSGSGYGSSAINLTPSSGTISSTPIYVVFSPTLAQAYSGNITHTSTGASTMNVAVSGTGTTPPIPGVPVAITADPISSTEFTAKWNASSGATGYRLDVYTKTEGTNSSDLFISEYIEGSSFNKVIEIYNGTGATVDLSIYSLRKQSNGVGTFGGDLPLTGTLANGEVYVIAHSSANATILAQTDQTAGSTPLDFNGNDAVALYKSGTQIDVVGVIDQVTNWGIDVTLVRNSDISAPNTLYSISDWTSYASNTLTYLGLHTMDGASSTNDFVIGYENLNVGNVTSYLVTGLNPSTTYYYVVRAVNSGGTSANSNEITVTTLPLPPTAFAVNGGGEYCFGTGGLPVGVDDSEVGVTYTLSPGGATVAGTGNAISFGNKTAGTYTVSGTNAGGTTAMTGSAVITENALPAAYTVSGGGSYCAGGAGLSIELSDSEIGVNYELYIGGVATANIVEGTGNSISFAGQTTAGTYTIVATKATCSLAMSGSSTISINQRPTVTFTDQPGANACVQTPITYRTELDKTQYTWSYTGVSPTDYVISAGGQSTDSYVTLTWLTLGNKTVSINYTDVNLCTAAAPTPSTATTINGRPVATFTVEPPSAICAYTEVTYTTQSGFEDYFWELLAAQNTDYELISGGTSTSNTLTLKWLSSTANTTVRVNYANSSGCTSILPASSIITVNALPSAPEVTTPVQYCLNATASALTATGSSLLWYTVATGGTGSATAPTPSTVSAGNTSYWVSQTNGSSCEGPRAEIVVTIYPITTVPTVNAGSNINMLKNTSQILSGATATNYTSVLWEKLNGAGNGTFDGTGSLTSTLLNPEFLATTEGQANYKITVTGYAGCGDPAVDIITISILSTDPIEWKGITEDWNDPDNWFWGAVPVAENNVKIPYSTDPYYKYPTIFVGDANAYCKNIEIIAGASLIDNRKLTITGKITVKTPLVSADRWHFISSPVSGAISEMFTGDFLYDFNTSTNGYTPILSIYTTLASMKGYALYVDAGYKLDYVGGLNKESSYGIDPTSADKWHLVGNPYPSAIDWDATGWDKSGINGAVYIYTGGYNWSTYVAGAQTNTGSNIIAATQGFFVRGNGGAFSMTNSVCVHDNSVPFYKKSNRIVPDLVRLEVSGNGYKDEAVVRFKPEATAEFDGDFDALKRYGDLPEAAQLYTIANIPLSINSLPETDMVPVGVKIGTNGKYTIAATEINDLQFVFLEDKETGIYTNLSKEPYTFDAIAGDINERFKLHFSPLLSVEEAKKVSAIVYSHQQTVHINMKETAKGDIFIYNIAGQLVATKLAAQGSNEIKLSNVGNYIVKVVSKNSTVVRKVFIQ